MLAHSYENMMVDKLPANRKPVAVVVLEDHIRDDAVKTLAWFSDNDVAIKIISGDNPVTVAEVSRRVGIKNAELFVSLEGMSDLDVVEAANQYTVFGRVTPEQKRLLVKSLKAQGHTVAMTGDGVNDILALKEADCSIAMANGSEAARNISHLILMDSNFANMPQVVHEGRRVVNNIQKSSTLFLMKTFLSVVLSWIVIIFGLSSYPIIPRQLMLLEIAVIGIPAFFLAFQSNNQRIKGSFLVSLLKKAIPSGLTLVLSYLLISSFLTIFKDQGILAGLSETDYNLLSKTVTTFSVTLTGWIVLTKLCQPFDMYRAMLVIVFGIIAIVPLQLFATDFFEMMPLDQLGLPVIFMMATFVLLSYFVLTILFKAIQNFKIGDSVVDQE
jgi:cation-transporting ATPase E